MSVRRYLISVSDKGVHVAALSEAAQPQFPQIDWPDRNWPTLRLCDTREGLGAAFSAIEDAEAGRPIPPPESPDPKRLAA